MGFIIGSSSSSSSTSGSRQAQILLSTWFLSCRNHFSQSSAFKSMIFVVDSVTILSARSIYRLIFGSILQYRIEKHEKSLIFGKKIGVCSGNYQSQTRLITVRQSIIRILLNSMLLIPLFHRNYRPFYRPLSYK